MSQTLIHPVPTLNLSIAPQNSSFACICASAGVGGAKVLKVHRTDNWSPHFLLNLEDRKCRKEQSLEGEQRSSDTS